jgi:chromosome segregation ATPase
MAKVGAQRAAELTGKSKSTIQRAMNNGKLSFELDANARRIIDVSELERAFGLKQANSETVSAVGAQQELEKASSMLEMERFKMRIKMLEDQLESANTQIEDMRQQRDQWQKQASQVLLTSEYHQKQADELRTEIREREERARERRQQKLEARMKSLQAENENASQSDAAATPAEGFTFNKLWKRAKQA